MAHDSGLSDEEMAGGTPDDHDPTPLVWRNLLDAAARVVEEMDRYHRADSDVYPEELISLIDEELREALRQVLNQP